jgi:hypothetical protein
MIYFIQRRSDKAIKIGFVSGWRRMIERGAELRREHGRVMLINVKSGNLKDERELHKLFQVERLEGEWFTPSQKLTDYIGGISFSTNTDDVNVNRVRSGIIDYYRNPLVPHNLEAERWGQWWHLWHP